MAVKDPFIQGPHKMNWSADFNIWNFAGLIGAVIGAAWVFGGDTRAMQETNTRQDKDIAAVREEIKEYKRDLKDDIAEIKGGVERIEQRQYEVQQQLNQAARR